VLLGNSDSEKIKQGYVITFVAYYIIKQGKCSYSNKVPSLTHNLLTR